MGLLKSVDRLSQSFRTDCDRSVRVGCRPRAVETVEDIEWALGLLAGRFERVVWAPGNHDLWTPAKDPVQLRGQQRYEHLVELCRRLGVVSPEDDYVTWAGPGGPVVLVADHADHPLRARLPDRVDDVVDHRPAGQGVQHLDERGAHPLSLAGREDDRRQGPPLSRHPGPGSRCR